nr:MAG TPA: hypothetical protein [Caudoviricetes sp.]
MRVELNEKLQEKLQVIAQLMKTEKRVPQTAYFPFIVCFEWVNPFGMLVKSEVQKKRVLLCEAYNTYLQADGSGSFEQVQKCLDALLIELDNYAFVDITEEAKSKLDKNKVQLSAFMNATYKKKSRGE